MIVVLSHLGFTDGGYGYGIPVYGDRTLAAKLNSAGKPVNFIIGGHSHTNLAPPATVGVELQLLPKPITMDERWPCGCYSSYEWICFSCLVQDESTGCSDC